ncbi:MAG: hypothetical protein KY445_13100 [Armatimonadetes bacterium]|nr:hypothetical protein [Armatimonadota bacterium]
MNFRLGIDGGGTKTRAVVIDADCKILGEGASGSSNPYAVGIETAVAHVLQAADAALGAARLSRGEIGGWGLGLGGVRSSQESAPLLKALRLQLGEGTPIVLQEDVIAAHCGAFGGHLNDVPQIVCIAGTGANCFGTFGDRHARADGLGPLVGDRGSGYRIGEGALRHAGRALDGVLPPSDFTRAIVAHFGANDAAGLIGVVYAADFGRAPIAGLVPLVLQFSETDFAAREILEDAGRELALSARAVLNKLSADHSGAQVALIGSVLAHAHPVRRAFEGGLGEGVELVEARFESAIGAALLV